MMVRTMTAEDNKPGAAGTVLVVDDEPMVREVVSRYVGREGFLVVEADDGPSALEAIAKHHPDLVLLDVMLPGLSGLEVLRTVRSSSAVPIILLTALGDETDRVLGLELGADDYVVKPFSPREVTARVRSVLRRSRPALPSEPISFGDITIDFDARVVTRSGDAIELTRREHDLLAHFVRSPGEALTRNDLLQAVWGSSSEWQDPSTVTVHVRRLRKKLEPDPTNPSHLLTVFGVGYRFEP